MGINNPILYGSGRYVQEPGAIRYVGHEVALYGKRVFVVGGKTALSVVWDRIRKDLDERGIAYNVQVFSGQCSHETTAVYTKRAADFGAEVVLGIGGGRAVDTSKVAAHQGGYPVVTFPTSAATCAATSAYPVVYYPEGGMRSNEILQHEVASMLIDSEVIATQCPPKMLASGVIDSLSKYIETTYNIHFRGNFANPTIGNLCYTLSEYLYRMLMEKGERAVHDVAQGKLTKDVEDVIFYVVALTGMISSLGQGEGHVAHAHALYTTLCSHFNPIREKLLHGEIVGMGLPVQLALGNGTQAETDELIRMIRSMGAPVKLTEIGFEPTKENLDTLVYEMANKVNMGTEEHMALLHDKIHLLL